MALVEVGGPECTALMEHAKRPNKRHLIRRKWTLMYEMRDIIKLLQCVLLQS